MLYDSLPPLAYVRGPGCGRRPRSERHNEGRTGEAAQRTHGECKLVHKSAGGLASRQRVVLDGLGYVIRE